MSKKNSTTTSKAKSTAELTAKRGTYCEVARVAKNSENVGDNANGKTVQRDGANTTAVAPPVVHNAPTTAVDAPPKNAAAPTTVVNAPPKNRRARREAQIEARRALLIQKAASTVLAAQVKHANAAYEHRDKNQEEILIAFKNAQPRALAEKVAKLENALESLTAKKKKVERRLRQSDLDNMNLASLLDAAQGEDAVEQVEPAKDTNMSRRTEKSCKQASARIQQSRKAKSTKAKAENNPTKVMRRSNRNRVARKK